VKKKIFLICPVRNVGTIEREHIAAYVAKLEAEGNSVYWPERDTKQDDPVGVHICAANRRGIVVFGAV